MSQQNNSCVFNSMIDCAASMRKCARCGWNPDVQEKRLKKIFDQNPEEQGLLICRK